MNDSTYELLESYAGRVRKKTVQAEEYALLSKSIQFRDVVATVAAGAGTTCEALSASLDQLDQARADYAALASLGRIVALQNINPEDRAVGRKLLHVANDNLPRTKIFQKYRQLEFELLYESGQYVQAKKHLENNPELLDVQNGYLEVDLRNPFISSNDQEYDNWLSGFNEVFNEADRQSIVLSGSATHPFDRLNADVPLREITEGPLVSVIMTSYEPESEAFMTAAHSILDQTWKNLELIIVDDASPNRAIELLESLAEEDPRVKLVLLTENGGTYKARNVGLEISSGEFVTGQDSDDWSHPERIEAQVTFLLENTELAGVVTSAVRTDENLCRIMPGLSPTRRCEVSFMTPLKLARDAGGYLNARKAADSEFRQRVEFHSQREVGVISDPLYIIRLMPNSLSRGDFSAGWSHQSRRAFWNATLYWHANTPPSDLSLGDGVAPPLPIPPRFQISKPIPDKFDCVFAADWRGNDGWQRSLVDEVTVLATSGLTVGMLQMESPNSNASTSIKPNLLIQALINSGLVKQVTSEQEVTVTSLVIHDPSIMQFPTTQPSNMRVENVIFAPFTAPWDLKGSNIKYLHEDCTRNAEQYFSSKVLWVFLESDKQSLSSIQDLSIDIHSEPWPLVLDMGNWTATPARRRSSTNLPVIGRSCQNSSLYWPDKEVIEKLWPTDGTGEVWILGDARGALRNLGEKYYSDSWVSFREGEIFPEDFMRAIDFFVYFPNEDAAENVCREAFEATATGRIAILPDRFRTAHGDTALYSEPDGVPDLIERYWKDRDLHRDQVENANRAFRNLFMNENAKLKEFLKLSNSAKEWNLIYE